MFAAERRLLSITEHSLMMMRVVGGEKVWDGGNAGRHILQLVTGSQFVLPRFSPLNVNIHDPPCPRQRWPPN